MAAKFEKLTVTVPADMARTVAAVVEAGEYTSTSEAVRDALRVWQRLRLEDFERLAHIRARVQQSLADPRPDFSGEQVDAQLAGLVANKG